MRARKLRSEAVLEHVLHLNEADVLPTGRAIDAFILKLEALAVEPGVGGHFRRARCIFWCSFFRFLVLIRRHAHPCPVAVGLWESVANFSGARSDKNKTPLCWHQICSTMFWALACKKSEPFSEAPIFSYPMRLSLREPRPIWTKGRVAPARRLIAVHHHCGHVQRRLDSLPQRLRALYVAFFAWTPACTVGHACALCATAALCATLLEFASLSGMDVHAATPSRLSVGARRQALAECSCGFYLKMFGNSSSEDVEVQLTHVTVSPFLTLLLSTAWSFLVCSRSVSCRAPSQVVLRSRLEFVSDPLLAE